MVAFFRTNYCDRKYFMINATELIIQSSLLSNTVQLSEEFKEMKTMINLFLNLKKFQATKVDPNFVLLLLVIIFFILLFAVENIVKLTLLLQ